MNGCYLAMVLVAQQVDHTKLLKAIRSASEANRAALSHVESHFEYVSGVVDSEEAARAERVQSKATARGVFVLDGPKARYQRVFLTAQIAAATWRAGPATTVSTIFDVCVVTDGDRTLTGTAPGA